MASENQVTIVGNVTDDPELRYTPSGAAVANFTVAVNKRFRTQDGQWEDKLDGFFRCNCWRDMAENVTESLQKGSRVIVVGRLQQRSWETSEGQKRYEIEIQVDEVGPSLRWATAQVQKSSRSSGGFGGGQGGGQQGGGQGGGSWGAPQGGQGAPQGGQAGGAPQGGQAGGTPSDDWGSAPVGGQPVDEGGF
jgi:single-strand DNA-binding protein